MRRCVGLLLLSLLTLMGCYGGDKARDQAELFNDSTIEGKLEVVDGAQIYGWVWDAKRPGHPIRVDIYDGTTLLATVPADEFRQDLLDLGVGHGKHVFDYTTPDGLKDGKEHKIRVKVAGTDIELPGSPQTLILEFP